MNTLKLIRKIHLYVGVLAALPLVTLGLTGAMLVIEDPVDEWLNPTLLRIQPQSDPLPLNEIVERLAVHPVALQLPRDNTHPLVIRVRNEQWFVDPYTARVLGTDKELRTPMRFVHQLHTRLVTIPHGDTIVALSALLLLLLGLSGPFIWFKGRFRGVHATAGITATFAMVCFGFTGAMIHWFEPPPLASPKTDCRAPLLKAEQFVATSSTRLPGATATGVSYVEDDGVVGVQARYPEDRTPMGRSRVLMNACNGEVLRVIDTRTASLGYKYGKMWNREIHTGDIFGWPTRLLAFCFALVLPVLAVSGPLLSWRRKFRRRANNQRNGRKHADRNDDPRYERVVGM